MNIEIKINKQLFDIAKKYKIESALLFDKIIYLKLIKSSYDVFVDICLWYLLEMMINDGMVTIFKDKYISTSKGDKFLQDINLLSKGKYKALDVITETLTDDFITKYLNCFKVNGKFIKKQSGQTLGSSSRTIKDNFIKFFNNYYAELCLVLDKKNINTPIEDIIIKSTINYIETNSSNNYLYCRRADYFIKKQDTNKIITSDLFNEMLVYIENEQDDNQPSLFKKFDL